MKKELILLKDNLCLNTNCVECPFAQGKYLKLCMKIKRLEPIGVVLDRVPYIREDLKETVLTKKVHINRVPLDEIL